MCCGDSVNSNWAVGFRVPTSLLVLYGCGLRMSFVETQICLLGLAFGLGFGGSCETVYGHDSSALVFGHGSRVGLVCYVVVMETYWTFWGFVSSRRALLFGLELSGVKGCGGE